MKPNLQMTLIWILLCKLILAYLNRISNHYAFDKKKKYIYISMQCKTLISDFYNMYIAYFYPVPVVVFRSSIMIESRSVV